MNTPSTTICHRRCPWISLIGAALAMQFLLAGEVSAQTVWVNPSTGSWFDAGNWSSGAPNTANNPQISNGGTAQILAGGTALSNYAYLGLTAADSGSMVVDGSGSSWTNTNELYVGFEGAGTLTIRNGGSVSDTQGYICYRFGASGSTLSKGTVLVTGLGSTWNNSGVLFVGFLGTAELAISGGGAVFNAEGRVGGSVGSGTVLVDGIGSTWTNRGDLLVGNAATGVLTIQNGGAVSNNIGILGKQNASSNGTAIVKGAGSTWTNRGELTVGNEGTGRLSIQEGGSVFNTYGFIGKLVGSNGAVQVDGAGSAWHSSNIVPGYWGSGQLTIQNGGTVSSVEGTLGFNAGSNGTAVVTGAGSTWAISDSLGVGNFGTGMMTIQNGGAVSDTTGVIAYSAGLQSTMLVTGAGSIWRSSGAIFVAYYDGTGLLAIQNGGAVFSGGGVLGLFAGGHGSVLVDGPGSTWTSNGALAIGQMGAGLLTIQNGGAVNVDGGAGTVILTQNPGSTGTLNVGAFGGGTTAGALHAAIVTGGGGGTAVVNFNQTDTTAFEPKITGSISVNQLGSGTTIFNGANTYTGNTNISGGVLAVNGSIASPSTFVNPGGTLGGTGSVLGLVVNSGIVKPGNSPGTLTIGGNYTQLGNGTLQIAVAGSQTGQFSVLAMGGKAMLDGTLQVVKSGAATVKVGDTLKILTAVGGVSGAFSTIVNPFASGSLIGISVIYETNDVLLTFTQNSFVQYATLAGLAPNQIAVAGALDRVASDPRATQAIAFLNGEPLGNVAGDLAKISPEELTSIFHIAKSLANIQTANIQRRLEEIRSEADSSAGGITPAGGVTGAGGGAHGPVGSRGKAIVPALDERWGVWFTGNGEFTRVGSTTNAAGFSLDSGGVTAGVDYRFTDHFAAGISLGYMNTTASISNGGKVDVDGGRVGAYATYFDRGLHFDAAVSGGPNSYSTRRATPNNTVATGSPEGTEVNLLFAAGYDWKWKGVTLGPVASFQYTNVQLNGFTERGAFAPLSIAAKNADSARSALGVHATFDVKAGRAIIRPEVRAAWQHEFGDTSYSLTSTFATLGGSAFTVAGPETGRDSLLVGAGFSILWNERFSTTFFYDGELLRSNYSSNNVSVGFRYRF